LYKKIIAEAKNIKVDMLNNEKQKLDETIKKLK
jgi:hypothetical protein